MIPRGKVYRVNERGLVEWLVKNDALFAECEWGWIADPASAYVFKTYDERPSQTDGPNRTGGCSADDARQTATMLNKEYGWGCSPYVVSARELTGDVEFRRQWRGVWTDSPASKAVQVT